MIKKMGTDWGIMAKGNLVRQMKLKFDFSLIFTAILKNVLSFNTKR